MKKVDALWTSFCNAALDAFFPSKCPLCERLDDIVPCNACRGRMVVASPNWVQDSGKPLAFRACLFEYEDMAAKAVRQLKYHRSTSLAEFMAWQVAQAVQDLVGKDECLVPVPIHISRRRDRGFNQAELLCQGEHGREVRTDLLRRVRATRQQAGLKRADRLKNLEGAFAASPEVKGRRIVLVDDVLTSGQTARECAQTLLLQGAESVGFIAFAGDLNDQVR